jgi:hypothetical protein
MLRRRPLLAAVLLALLTALAGASQVPFGNFLDPVPNLALPPFLDRAPQLGDRWTYNAPAPSWIEQSEVEITALEPWGDGWRYLVETRSIAIGVAESEWFFLADGRVLQGDEWTDGALSFDVSEPSVVVGRSPLRARREKLRRSGVMLPLTLGLPIEHRGRTRTRAVEGSPPWPSAVWELEARWRAASYCRIEAFPGLPTLEATTRREALVAWYDDGLGLVAWQRSTSKGCAMSPHARVLHAATVGGVTVP